MEVVKEKMKISCKYLVCGAFCEHRNNLDLRNRRSGRRYVHLKKRCRGYFCPYTDIDKMG